MKDYSNSYPLKLSGQIVSIEDCKRVALLIRNLVAAGKYHIAMDMREVSEVSGSFSGFLTEILNLLQKEKGDFIFYNVNPFVAEILRTVGYGDRIHNEFFPSIKEEKLALVVEDEPIVRELTKEFLTEMGYSTFEAENGLEGLRKYSMFKDVISFIVMDIEMPIIDGVQMLQRIVQTDPNVRVIIASGFTLDYKVHMLRQIKDDAVFLQKPYLFDEFERAVKSVLSLNVSSGN